MNLAIQRTAPMLPPVQVQVPVETPAREQSQASQARGPSVLSLAVSMNDDLSMTMSAHRARLAQGSSADAATSPWVERVLEEEGPQKVLDIRKVLQAQRHPTPADIRLQLARLFPDPSDQVAVLRALLDDETLERLQEVLGQTLEQMLAEQGADGSRQRVAAGLNVAITARLAAQGSSLSPVLLRDCYRDFLGGQLDPVEQYALWVELFGFSNRTIVVDFIGRALIADLYSLDPSCSAIEFGPLLNCVGQLRLLRAADAAIVRESWNARLMARLGVDEAVFSRSVLDIVRKGQGWEALFDGLLSRLHVVCTLQEVTQLTQGFQRALRTLPVQLWASVDKLASAMEELQGLVAATLARESLRTSSAQRHSVAV